MFQSHHLACKSTERTRHQKIKKSPTCTEVAKAGLINNWDAIDYFFILSAKRILLMKTCMSTYYWQGISYYFICYRVFWWDHQQYTTHHYTHILIDGSLLQKNIRNQTTWTIFILMKTSQSIDELSIDGWRFYTEMHNEWVHAHEHFFKQFLWGIKKSTCMCSVSAFFLFEYG